MTYTHFICHVWRKSVQLCLLLLFFTFVGNTYASSSKIDSNFYPVIDGDGTTYAIAIQPDGRILVGGSISKANGEEQSGVTRLNPDGSVDPSFSLGMDNAFNGLVYDIALQNDGKILIVGMFTNVQGQTRNHIARLNSNGSLDTTFLTEMSGANAPINSVQVQPDGKILIGGRFSLFNNVQRNNLTRLNSDGSLDMTFLVNGGNPLGEIYTLALQSDGKIIIGGRFGEINATQRNKIARLNVDGTLDNSFLNNLSGANNDVHTIYIQTDGKVLVGGQFTSFNSISRNRIARLNIDGSLDTGFINNLSGANNIVLTVVQQTDGKVLVGGSFSNINGSNLNRIARLNDDGSLDVSFTSNLTDTPENIINVIVPQTDGKILVGGRFYFIGQTFREGIARLNSDGTIDPTLAFVQLQEPGIIRNIARQNDGKLLISGKFRFVNGIYTENLGRVNSDGSLDPAFSVGSNFGSGEEVNAILPLSNGKIIIGGIFDIFSQAGEYRNLARLNSDGSIDTTFTLGNPNGNIESLALQSDGKFIVGGSFNFINGVARNNIARLHPDGTVDTSFLNNLQGSNSFVLSSLIQQDGKVIIGGAFGQVNGVTQRGISRLNNDGSIDTTFTGNIIGLVRDIEQQPDGKFIVGGDFTTVNGISRNRIARLNTDGSLDNTFLNNLSGTNGEVLDVAIQENGQIVIAGNFTSVNGIPKKLARLNSDGSLDISFNFNLSPTNAATYSLLFESDGDLLVGGYFNKVNGITRASLFRAVRTSKLYDFDGDGKSDISVFRPSNGAWYIDRSTDGFFGVTFGFGTDLPVPADYDGDGKTDVAVFRPSDGGWYYLKSSNGTFVGLQWGLSTDIPIPGDFDGDGKADVNVFRPSDGGWYRLNSSTGAFVGVTFGQSGDKPLVSNFDGDAKNDIAVFRPSTGAFYSLDSSTGSFRGVAFGLGTDIPTMGDFDGDGKTDVAVFRASNGYWYRLNSSNGAYVEILFGQNGDIPVTADYDGDGKSDIAVFRNGEWYYLRSSNGSFFGQAFGFGTDKPIPAAFTP